MRMRHVLIGLVLLIMVILIAVNWQTLSVPLTLNLLFGRVEAPMGVALLVTIGVLVAVYQFLVLRLETLRLIEHRKSAKEVERVRGLAEDAETSRIEALREHLDLRLEKIERELEELLRSSGKAASPADLSAGGQ